MRSDTGGRGVGLQSDARCRPSRRGDQRERHDGRPGHHLRELARARARPPPPARLNDSSSCSSRSSASGSATFSAPRARRDARARRRGCRPRRSGRAASTPEPRAPVSSKSSPPGGGERLLAVVEVAADRGERRPVDGVLRLPEDQERPGPRSRRRRSRTRVPTIHGQSSMTSPSGSSTTWLSTDSHGRCSKPSRRERVLQGQGASPIAPAGRLVQRDRPRRGDVQ